MGKFTGVLLASDFDNTIVDTASSFRGGQDMPAPSARTLEALAYFMENGGAFTVATGRALASFQRLVDGVPMNVPAVLCNGAALYDFRTGEYLETNMLDREACLRAQVMLDAHPAVAVEAYHVGNVIHAVHPNDITRHHEHITHVGVTEAPSLMAVPVPLGKLMFEGEHGELETIRDWFTAQGWAGEYELIFSDPTLLEMTALGANKGAMVLRLAERLGIGRAHIYCAGDESNDLSMLAVAAEGFAPANCAPAVRESGAPIVSDAAHDALADIIAVLDKRYS